jgi:hypothetical protein
MESILLGGMGKRAAGNRRERIGRGKIGVCSSGGSITLEIV